MRPPASTSLIYFMQFDIQLQAEQTERLLAAIAHDLDAPHDMLESIGQALLNVNEDRHKEQVDPEGAPWAPLHPKTIQRKTNPPPLL